MDVLNGAKVSIGNHHPIMFIEIIKSDRATIEEFLSLNGYKLFILNMNLLAIHQNDPVLNSIKIENNVLSIT